MPRSRYIVGIDLGTTNCAVAYVDTRGREKPTADIKPFDVPQLVAPGETAARGMLPSFLYLPGQHELPPGSCRLPWDENADQIVGEFARTQGAKVPGHLVSSAKSWLCHAGVDREEAILPWGSPSGSRKVSPVDASAAYLIHIRDAWNARFACDQPDLRLEVQEVVLTVPASFDEAARELTVAAARKAGLDSLTLLEEPQAAFYCWIVTHQNGWQREVRAGELILVCDIGGGTTDFSLITVVETPTGPGFRRVAVGDHLMLGGDNIDLALAHRVEAKLSSSKLDPEQWSALRFACRAAKERLLGPAPPERWPVTIAGRGSKVIGGSLKSELTREEVREIVIEGFFPITGRADDPSKSTKLGVQEFGLPFVADPAISKHVSAFLRKHREQAVSPEGFTPDDRPVRPDAILFNGGALTPEIVRERIITLVSSWFCDDAGPAYAPRVLSNASLDLAVAQGAAYYGVVRRGGGIRIGGGTARSYYVGFESAATETKPWLCVVPRDAEEGDEISIDNHDFELLMGQPVLFPLASSSIRADDRPGNLIANDPASILVLPPLQSLMKVGRKAKAERVAVKLAARVTEVGTIELWCQAQSDERKWRLQIQLRAASRTAGPRQTIAHEDVDSVVLEQSLVDAGIAAIREAFALSAVSPSQGPSSLVKQLEESIDLRREQWPPSAIRAFWEPLREASESRFKGPRHESRWLNLAGFCLRPGTGYPLDELRVKALWPVFHQGLRHIKDSQCWAEWWILWRRVGAGLNRQHHDEIGRRLIPFLLPSHGGSGSKKGGRPKPEPHELAEMWRCAASLERLPTETKEALGKVLIKDLSRADSIPSYSLWCLGRLGARAPLYGAANAVVSQPIAEGWVDILLGRRFDSGRETLDAKFALVQLGRVTGDRIRDLAPDLRQRVADRLRLLAASDQEMRTVLELQDREASEEGAALGDSLPIGLRLGGNVSASAPT